MQKHFLVKLSPILNKCETLITLYNPISFSPLISPNLEISPQNFLTLVLTCLLYCYIFSRPYEVPVLNH